MTPRSVDVFDPTSKSAVLLDCFGTLVEYDARATGPGYDQTYLYLRDLGYAGAYDAFVSTWQVMADAFERSAETSQVEFSMETLAQTYLSSYGLPANDDEVEQLVDRYLDEWRTGISSIPGVADLLEMLHARYRIVVVTNTHDAWLPLSVLEQFGLRAHVDGIVTSVEHGRRKPHPSIYEAALTVAEADAGAALFVGDSFSADYCGPRAAGIDALLIDPAAAAPVEDGDRLVSVLDLRTRLLGTP